MKMPDLDDLNALWSRHHAEWRDQAQIASQWREATETNPELLTSQARGAWWQVLAETGVTLLVTREYEHLIMALTVVGDRPHVTYMPMPHPSGMAFDPARGVVNTASTRNPNQIFELSPVTGLTPRLDIEVVAVENRPLIPIRSHYYPGSFYMHDLAMIGGVLHANAVGQNAVIRFLPDGTAERAWWPRCIETEAGPVFGQNHIQLNSIAAGATLGQSFFSASADRISARRPGHKNFPVNRRGVVFSGASREPIARGLTRPHSARLHNGTVWVDNSGYGELGVAAEGRFTPLVKLPGWTRGLGFHGDIAFVGTSRVIPRFRQYAPGLDVDASVCGLHAVNTVTGTVLGSLIWPYGNQIFAVEPVPQTFTTGFPFAAPMKSTSNREKLLFYSFQVGNEVNVS